MFGHLLRRSAVGVVPLLFVGLFPLCLGAQTIDLSVLGVEVTQALQNYDVLDPWDPLNNSNTLVAGNLTTARVFVRVTSTPGPTPGIGLPVPGVTAFFTVFVNGIPRPVFAPQFPGSISAPAVPDPENESHSLNFVLPLDIHPGDSVDLVVELDPLNAIKEGDETNNRYVLKGLEFKCRETPEIAYVPIDYSASTENDPSTLGLPDPDRIGPGRGDDFIFGIFPFPEDRSRYHEAPTPPLGLSQNIDSAGVSSDLLLDLAALRQTLEPVPDFLYGWFRENPYGGNGRALLGGRVAFGNSQVEPNRYQRTFAHELGHLFDLFHNSRTVAPDTGWDVARLLGLGHVMPGDKYDIMVPGLHTPQAWVDDVTYEAFLDHEVLDCGMDSALDFTDAPFITATVAREVGQGRLHSAFGFPRHVASSVSDPAGTVGVRALGRDGEILQEMRVSPDFESETGELYHRVPIALTLSQQIDAAAIAAIELFEGSVISDRIERSAAAPAVTIRRPAPGDTLEGVFPVSWEGYDGDGDALTYMVQYSSGHDREGRQRWVPLGVRLEGTTLQVDSGRLAASGDATIRVLASDGLNTTAVEVPGLYLAGDHPPRLTVADREGAKLLQEGSLLILQASAYDRETGILPDEAFQWSSGLDGPLGIGPTLQTPSLSPGVHRITVSATDASELRTDDSVHVTVVASSLGEALRRARAERPQASP